MVYRDPFATLRSRISAKRILLTERERELPPLLRAMAPERIRARLRELGGQLEAGEKASTLDDLTELEAAVDGMLAVYDELAAAAAELTAFPEDVPDPDPPSIGPPFTIEEKPQLRFRACLEARIRDVFEAGDPDLVRWGDHAYLARHAFRGAPLKLHVTFQFGGSFADTFDATLWSSMPVAAPALDVRLRRAYHVLGALVGVRSQKDVGRAAGVNELDRLFVVDVEDDARAIVSPKVARSLVTLAGYGLRSLSLVVRDGTVRLSWQGSFELDGDRRVVLAGEAVAAVMGVREAVGRG